MNIIQDRYIALRLLMLLFSIHAILLQGMDDVNKSKILYLTITKTTPASNAHISGATYSIGNNKTFAELGEIASFCKSKKSDIQTKEFSRAEIGGSTTIRVSLHDPQNKSLVYTNEGSVLIHKGIVTLEKARKKDIKLVIFRDTDNNVCGAFSYLQAKRICLHNRDVGQACDASLLTDNIINLCKLEEYPDLFQKASNEILSILQKFKQEYDAEEHPCPHTDAGQLCPDKCILRQKEEEKEAAEITEALKPFLLNMQELQHEEKQLADLEKKVQLEQEIKNQQKRKIVLISLLCGSLLAIMLAIVGYQKYFMV